MLTSVWCYAFAMFLLNIIDVCVVYLLQPYCLIILICVHRCSYFGGRQVYLPGTVDWCLSLMSKYRQSVPHFSSLSVGKSFTFHEIQVR